MISSIVALACFLTSVFFATVSESLRNFLRSRLAYVCRSRNNVDRFGQILRDDEAALQASQLIQLTTLTASLVLVLASPAGDWFPLGHGRLWFDVLSLATVCWLLIGVFPWAVSRVAAEYVLYYFWPLISGLTIGLLPMLSLARRIDTLMHRIAGRSDPEPESVEKFTEEIQSVVDEGEREGLLESRAGRMIQRVMELQEEDVRAVMTTRTDIITIQANCSLEEARRQLLDAGHSRIPLVEGSTDDIVGILYARDLLETLSLSDGKKELREIVRPALYVPETTTIDALLERMKQERLHLAIVLDEYGGVTGLVTLEDILEEIVGDIADEFDEREEELYEIIDPYTVRVDARMHLDELNEQFDLNLPDERDFDTIGGFVFSQLGRIPKKGERLVWEQLAITILEATERKLVRLELRSTVPWPGSTATSETAVSQ
ncbi:hemolysin family protein [Planctomicrobium piriforme]|uniref:Hemolysin, contains CBS domains n=1 Tax=Planctomicrobium piriforme TaxID=1576369 RepID=A0A1I3BMF8_9PLAN|nr:hemolysin family protein [Planctomicrobium piriforme]SFH63458.1 Hemolysin, contains CBS domains [Planctomicrobium piriforme]